MKDEWMKRIAKQERNIILCNYHGWHTTTAMKILCEIIEEKTGIKIDFDPGKKSTNGGMRHPDFDAIQELTGIFRLDPYFPSVRKWEDKNISDPKLRKHSIVFDKPTMNEICFGQGIPGERMAELIRLDIEESEEPFDIMTTRHRVLKGKIPHPPTLEETMEKEISPKELPQEEPQEEEPLDDLPWV